MGIVADGFKQTFRDYNTDGVPASGAHEVEKSEARQLGTTIEQLVGLLEIGIPSYATAAALPTSPVPAAGSMARVYADPTPSNNVFWVYNGGWAIDEDLMTAITVQLSSDNSWTGVQSFEGDIFSGLARIGRQGSNLRFGQNAVRTAATGATNIGIGDDALVALTTGDRNVVVGSTSGRSITSGQFNVLMGYAGLNLTTGNNNVFAGADAGSSITTTSKNIAIGSQAMWLATGLVGCVAIGDSALRSATGLLAVTAVGTGAGFALTTGAGFTGVGHNAGANTTTGLRNTAMGIESLVANVTGNYNAAFGSYALDANEGSGNVGVGDGAGYRQKSGSDNLFAGHSAGRGEDVSPGTPTYYDASRIVALGAESLRLGITDGADDNTAVGYRAGYNVTSGAGNTLLGSGAGGDLTSGDNNIVIGKDQEADSNTADDQINMGGRYFHDRIRLLERSADPAEPTEGNCVIWMGDGTGKGDDGDIMIASRAGGLTKWATLFDHSAGADW